MAASSQDACAGILMDESESLIARVRSGDAVAFRSIFERHHRLVLRFLYGMVGEHGLAEELTQETFMRAYRNINSLRDEAMLSTWLCGIAKNAASNALRSRRTEVHTVEIDCDNKMEMRSDELTPDAQLLNMELNGVIRDALSKLSEDKRLVFTLKVLQQKSYEEIALITGASIPKLKTDLHRAKTEMRRLIRPYLEASDEM